MKKVLLAIVALALPVLSNASAPLIPNTPFTPNLGQIPPRFSSSSETSTFEWGCPVSEVVNAGTSHEALNKISKECIEEARRAATEKEGVYEVIQVSVIVPDVQVTRREAGFHLQGTFFLETLVLKEARK